MRTLIIEDEKLAADRLELMLRKQDPALEIVGRLDGIEETVQWFRSHQEPDCMFLDIHLSDGSCFEIFREIQPRVPIIFTTAYDKYALEAFRQMSIDYLLKPVTEEDLSGALRKLSMLKEAMAPDYSVVPQLMPGKSMYKQRFLGKVGQKIFFIDVSGISFFVAENKIVHLVADDGYRYVVEHTLEQLEGLLDPNRFFRINRSVIIHVNAIEQVKPFLNSRLKVKMRFPNVEEDGLVISREKVAAFKQWADC